MSLSLEPMHAGERPTAPAAPHVPESPTAVIPASHADLLDRPLPATLTTDMASGRLQSTVIWYWRSGEEVRMTTMLQFRKAANLLARPRATLLVIDPADGRWLELRADVVPVPGDGMADLDDVGERYCGVRPYFGAVVPAELAEVETPATFRLVPRVVVVGPTPPAPPAPPVVPAAQYPPSVRGGSAPGGEPPAWGTSDQDVPLPQSHHDLLDRPLLAALATRLPDGRAQVQPVWCTRDGDVVVIATTLQRRKGRNLLADPRATVLVMDPADSSRWLEVRGDVELVTAGAVDVLDRLTREYTGLPAYYGHVAGPGLADLETRVTARLHPRRVNQDAVHR